MLHNAESMIHNAHNNDGSLQLKFYFSSDQSLCYVRSLGVTVGSRGKVFVFFRASDQQTVLHTVHFLLILYQTTKVHTQTDRGRHTPNICNHKLNDKTYPTVVL